MDGAAGSGCVGCPIAEEGSSYPGCIKTKKCRINFVNSPVEKNEERWGVAVAFHWTGARSSTQRDPWLPHLDPDYVLDPISHTKG